MTIIHMSRQESHCSAELQAYKLNACVSVRCDYRSLAGEVQPMVVSWYSWSSCIITACSIWCPTASGLHLCQCVFHLLTSLYLDLSVVISLGHRPGGSSPLAIFCICQDISLDAIPEVKPKNKHKMTRACNFEKKAECDMRHRFSQNKNSGDLRINLSCMKHK